VRRSVRYWRRCVCVLGCLLFAGCPAAPPGGGNGDSDGNGGTVRGRVQLPAGSTLDLAALRVATSQEDLSLGGDGSFSADSVLEGPAFYQVVDSASDKIALLGFGNQVSETDAELNARSTAVALLYISAAAYTLPPENIQAAIDLIGESSVIDDVAATVESILAANPLAVSDGSDDLVAAVVMARDTLYQSETGAKLRALQTFGERLPVGSRISFPYSRGSVSENAGDPNSPHPGNSKWSAITTEKRPALLQDGEDDTLVLIEPGGDVYQSGAQVLQNPGGAGIIVQNTYRRRGTMLIYKTGTENAEGVAHEIFPPKLYGDPVEVPTTVRLELFTSLYNVATGTAPFSPVTTDPVVLTREEGAAKTFFEIVILGASLDFVLTPPIMQDTRFFDFAPEWTAELNRLQFETLTMDFLVPVAETFAFGSVASLQQNRVRAFVEASKAMFDPILAAEGILLNKWDDLAKGVRVIIQNLGTNTILGPQWLRNVIDALAASNANQLNLDQATGNLRRVASAATIVAVVESILATGDLAAVVHDLQSSSSADSWQATAIARRVRLEPSVATVTLAAPSVVLTSTVNGLPDATLCYRWSTSGEHGILGDDLGAEGEEFVSKLNEVQYIADVAAIVPGENDTVTVDAYDSARVEGSDVFCDEPLPSDKYIGSATATIRGPNCRNPDELVDIPDERLRNLVANALSVDPAAITCADMERLASLNPGSIPNLGTLEGLQNAVNLQSLSCNFCIIGDEEIAVLEDLTELTDLYLTDNGISDLTPLRNMTKLRTLNLSNNRVASLAPLSGLTQLQSVNLSFNEMTSLDGFYPASLESFTARSAGRLEDVSALTGATHLTFLDLYNCNVSDISSIAQSTEMNQLDLEDNFIADISALAGMTKLEYLNFSENQIEDVGPLGNLTELTYLTLGNNQIQDVTALGNLIGLSTLTLDGNQVTDISALAPLGLLSTFDLSYNIGLSDIEAMSGMSLLINIGLRNTSISSLQPLVDAGLGFGSGINIQCTPAQGDTANIQILEDRGAGVYTQTDFCGP